MEAAFGQQELPEVDADGAARVRPLVSTASSAFLFLRYLSDNYEVL